MSRLEIDLRVNSFDFPTDNVRLMVLILRVFCVHEFALVLVRLDGFRISPFFPPRSFLKDVGTIGLFMGGV